MCQAHSVVSNDVLQEVGVGLASALETMPDAGFNRQTSRLPKTSTLWDGDPEMNQSFEFV